MRHGSWMAAAAAAAVILCAGTAYAGEWKQGQQGGSSSWWYDLGNGKWAEGWQWIDGDNDGVSERYYFDTDGWLLVDTMTPDGFTVNVDGKWTDAGNVRIQVSAVPGQEKEEAPAAAETSSAGQMPAESTAAQKPAETAAAQETEAAAPQETAAAAEGKGGPGAPAEDEEVQAEAAAQNTSGSAIVDLARTYVQKLRYVYGGFSLVTGTDCSGFTKLIFAQFGKELPRSTGDQLAAGTRLTADQVQPGDLVFWANSSGRVYHVGIISGNGKFIHASNTERGWVFEDNLFDMPAPAGYARY